MKRGTRMLAFLLSVLMLVGLLPFSVFAVTGENEDLPKVEVPAGGSAGDVSDEQLISAVGNDNIIFRTDFNAMTEPQFGNLKIDVFGGIAPHPDTNFNIVNGTKTTMAVVDDGNGGKALQFIKSTDTTQTYIDMINRGVADGDNTFRKLYDTKNKAFVFQADFKYGAGIKNNTLLSAITRVTGGNVTIQLVSVTEKGELYPSAQPGNIIGYLNSEVFTTVAVHVIPATNRYYIYINGVNVDADGYQFKSNSQLTQLSVTKTVDGTEYTTNEKEYILTAVRIYQLGNSTQLNDTDLCVDNVSAYYSDTYLGERESSDGFGELNGKVYRVVNGSRVAASTIGGYVYGTDGAITHYTVKTPAIDFSSVYTGKSGDQIRDAINKGNAPIRNDNLLPGHSMWEWAEIKAGADFRFNTLESDLTGYDAVEFNFYTDGVQQVPTLAIFSNSYTDPSDGKECYWNYFLNFGDKTYTAYKSDGKTSMSGVGRNPIAADGWTSYTIDLSAFGKNRDAKWTDIASVRFVTSGWDLDYAFAEDGTTRLFNNGTETIFFESINLVKYVPVSSVDDIFGDIVDGVQLPKLGYGWATFGNNTFYYAPWTNELVKSETIIDLESGLAYTFDAEGRCLGLANGIAAMGSDNYYFIDGVMQKNNVRVGEDTLKIGSNGRIVGIIGKSYAGYTPDAPYVNAPHSSDIDYIYKADFNDLTPGIINSKTGQSKLENYNKSADGKNLLSLIMKGNDIIVEDRGNGDSAIGFFNYTPNVDPYAQTWIDDTKTAGKRVVIDYDVKISDDWSGELNFLQLIGGTTRKFYGILGLNNEGYITLGGKYIARLQSDDYTRVSAVIDVPAKTIDLYINGVKLVSAYKFTSDDNFTKFGEIRFLQFSQEKGQGTIYLDNYFVYAADKPQYVVEGVTLRNGYVTEDDGVTRYYENGVIVPGKFQSVETLIGIDDFLNENSGKAVYTDKSYLAVFDRGGVEAINVNLPVSNISGYEYLEFDLYMSAKAPVDFLINLGQRERLYEVVDYDEATGVGYVTGNYIYGSGGTTIGNKTFKSKDGSLSISGSLRLKDGKYYLRTWNYQSLSYAFDSDELWNNIRKENPEDEGGWVTIQIPISSLSGSVKNEFELFQLTITGWSLNVNRPWNTSGNPNYKYPDGAKYTIRYSDVRIVKNAVEVFGTVAEPGWNEDETEYGDPITMTKATGVYVIDGVYYYFDANGKLVGKCDGIYDTVHYSNKSGKWEKTTAKRLFKDGEMQFGKISVTEDTFYLADSETGAFNYIDTAAEIDGKFYYFDQNGLASVCDGLVDGVYYIDGVRADGEIELEDGMYYFVNGVPTAAEIIKVENGVRVRYIYGENGKLVEKVLVVPYDITLTVIKDGKTVTETVSVSSGGTFKYIPRTIEGKTYVITDSNGNVVDSDFILIEVVNSSASFTITYTDAN